MTLVTTAELVAEAGAQRRGIGAFNVLHLETAEGLAAGAESAGQPLILQVSENCARFHGSLRPITAAALAVADSSEARLSLHLDHAESEDLVREAIDLGFSSVMFDASKLEFAENVARTAAMAALAHEHGLFIEAELGEVGGKDGVHAPGVRTDPQEARAFVAATGVDALAVAVGTSHAMATRDAVLDLGLVARLHDTVGLPLVLHGSSGVADPDLQRVISAGITKVNVSTHLNASFTGGVRRYLADHPTTVDSRRYVGAGRDSLARETTRLLHLLAGGRAS
ncbi:MAG: class II fructose-bisphosphate aldolase [Propionibacteriaceae bacterium]|nr:class II fructose-bisphosphate aldolase [Propionibacteriaceae bacterium]